MHLVIVVLIFFLVIIVAVVVVGSWIVVNIGRGVKRMIAGPAVKPRAAGSNALSNHAICSRSDCGAENPAQAQFCRRCGEPLAARAAVRGMRVA